MATDRPHPLREARELAGLSLRRLGAITETDFRKLALLEKGLRPSDRELSLLAAVYRCEPHILRDLLGLSPAAEQII